MHNIGHTTNVSFVVCHEIQHTAKFWHTTKKAFSVCQKIKHTADLWHTANDSLCHAPVHKIHGEDKTHGKCGQEMAHGKGGLCRRLFVVYCLPCATHGKHFAVRNMTGKLPVSCSVVFSSPGPFHLELVACSSAALRWLCSSDPSLNIDITKAKLAPGHR